MGAEVVRLMNEVSFVMLGIAIPILQSPCSHAALSLVLFENVVADTILRYTDAILRHTPHGDHGPHASWT